MLSPVWMKWEKPMPLAHAQSSTALHSAPDCETKAILPGGASSGAKLAFRPMPGTSRPMELGPSTRMPWALASARTASSTLRPEASAACCKPAVMMQAALAPFCPKARMDSANEPTGPHISARSGACGRLAMSG